MEDLRKLLVGKPEGMRTIGRSKRRQGEIECDDLDWICLDQDRKQLWTFVKTIMNFWIP
jgi:hypothetical protein